jgi:hypothetical protein
MQKMPKLFECARCGATFERMLIETPELCSRCARRCREASLCANRRQSASQQTTAYSTTSSAVASSEGGTVRPSARAVGMLMTKSNLVDCTTGRSAGLAPLRMRGYVRHWIGIGPHHVLTLRAPACAKRPSRRLIFRRCQGAINFACAPRATWSRNSSSAAIQIRSQ